MKKLLTLSIITAIAFAADGQLVTITETHQLPAFGDTVHYVDANSFGFDATGTGPVTNKLWDNSALLNTGTTYDFFYVDPTTIPTGYGKDSFPTANIARGESGAAGYFYYQNTINNINRIGWFSGTNNYGIYENGTIATEFHFPITAGQTVTSTYNGRYAVFGLGEDSVKIESGSLSINADMQGTLLLPTGAFYDVLRLHVLENFHIKVYLLGSALIDYVVQDDYYYWFSDTTLQAILVSGVTTIDGTPQTPVLRYQPIAGLTGLSEYNTKIATMHPNPSNGQFSITDYKTSNTNYTIEVFNVIGEKINFKQTQKESSIAVDISQVPDGVYFVKISSGQSVRTEKMVIQK